MRRRSRAPKAEAEPAPRAHVGMAYEDGELKHMAARPPFSFLSAVKYLTILSILLWWLPTFGQMIAGFVGGRRAGSPWRGVAASLIPLLVIFAGLYLLDHGAFGDPAAVRSWPAAAAEQVTSAPVVGPYADFAFGYFASFLAWIPAAIAQNMSGYLVTVIFAYIGGIVADQASREAAARGGSRVGVSIMQPLWAPLHRPRGRSKPTARLSRMHKVSGAVEASDEGEAEGPGEEEPAVAEATSPDEDETEPHATPSAPPGPASGKTAKTEKYVAKALRRYDRPRAAR